MLSKVRFNGEGSVVRQRESEFSVRSPRQATLTQKERNLIYHII